MKKSGIPGRDHVKLMRKGLIVYLTVLFILIVMCMVLFTMEFVSLDSHRVRGQ